MKNLAFQSLLRWTMVILPILTSSLIHLSLKSWDDGLSELGNERVKTSHVWLRTGPRWKEHWSLFFFYNSLFRLSLSPVWMVRRISLSSCRLLCFQVLNIMCSEHGAWSSLQSPADVQFYRLDLWEDDSRRRMRFVRNPHGSSHPEATLLGSLEGQRVRLSWFIPVSESGQSWFIPVSESGQSWFILFFLVTRFIVGQILVRLGGCVRINYRRKLSSISAQNKAMINNSGWKNWTSFENLLTFLFPSASVAFSLRSKSNKILKYLCLLGKIFSIAGGAVLMECPQKVDGVRKGEKRWSCLPHCCRSQESNPRPSVSVIPVHHPRPLGRQISGSEVLDSSL